MHLVYLQKRKKKKKIHLSVLLFIKEITLAPDGVCLV